MTAYKVTVLACDDCGEESDASAPMAAEVRDTASARGWLIKYVRGSGNYDYCPACAKKRGLL